jgi:cytochrome c553
MRLLSIATLVVLASSAAAAPPDDAGNAFFEKRIRPILVQHCYACHSAQAKIPQAGLMLDSREGVRKGGDRGPAIVPGKPEESLLVKAVRYNGKPRMPEKGKLPANVIADLEQWVRMGAPDPRTDKSEVTTKPGVDLEKGRKFWAFQPPRVRAIPVVKDGAWARGDIDRFILAGLEAKGIKAVGDADAQTLIRRLYFDLTGLPPTAEQIDAFVRTSEAKPQAAKEALVDGLLANPQFGERWGRHWLDVARYADSTGGGRSMIFKDSWRYRDYVIDSFNADKPYDRFITEQIAGDLLEAANPEQRRQQIVATAFLALGPTNYEEQDKDVLEMDVVDEQIDTMGRVFLGMTIGCARCHDHKFDPIPTKDYYALAGIMKSTHTLIHDNVSKWVEKPLPMSAEQEKAVKQYEATVAALKERIRVAKAADVKSGKTVVATRGVLAPSDLPGIVLDDTKAKRVGEWKPSKYTGNYIGEGYLYDDRSVKSEKTLTFVPEFPKQGRYEVRLAYIPGDNRDTNVPVNILHLDGEKTVHINMKEAPPIDGRFISLGTYRFNKNGQWYVMVSNEGTKGHISVDAVQFLAEEEDAKPAEKAAAPVKPSATEDVKKLEAEFKKMTESGPPRPLAMAVEEAAKVGDIKICLRGNITTRGEVAPRGFLQVTQPATAKTTIPAKESGRRELAAWLSSPQNPLTARVMVNRIWHHLFGAGIVRTVDEFGVTGELPSHPELLDYLALRFVQQGWSVKKLIREIVLSRTYQLSSELVTRSAERKEVPSSVDPENRLLWRHNRRRLDAESIRDTILSVSGKLDRMAGGSTMKPNTANETGYVFDDTRRSVYTPVFRNRLLELFEAFDFADPNLVMGRRTVSTTVTQALYLMNSPFVLDQSRIAARNLIAKADLDDAARLNQAYRAALGRLPTDRERELALAYLAGKTTPQERQAGWERVVQALFACVDFRHVN